MKLRKPQLEHTHSPRTGETIKAEGVAQKKARWDYEEEISDSYWSTMKQIMEWHRPETRGYTANWDSFIETAQSLYLLFPDRCDELDLDKEWDEINKSANEVRKRMGSWSYSDYAAYLALTTPERRGELNLNETLWDGLLEEMERHKQENSWWTVSTIAVNALILFPERRGQLGLDSTALDKILTDLQKQRAEAGYGQIQILRNLVILFPGCKDRLMLDENWDQITAYMHAQKTGDPGWFAQRAAEMKIAMADEVRITEQGIELIYKDPIRTEEKLPPRNLAA